LAEHALSYLAYRLVPGGELPSGKQKPDIIKELCEALWTEAEGARLTKGAESSGNKAGEDSDEENQDPAVPSSAKASRTHGPKEMPDWWVPCEMLLFAWYGPLAGNSCLDEFNLDVSEGPSKRKHWTDDDGSGTETDSSSSTTAST
jgi:hypothetical protein